MAESETVQSEQQEAVAPAEQAAAQAGTEVKQAEFNQVAPGQQSGQENLDLLLEIEMPITVMIGKAQIPLKKLLQLQDRC